MVRKAAFDRLKDPKAKPVIIGSVSTDRPQDAMALFGAEYLGWNIKFVIGYPSSNEIYLAFERGEIDVFGSGTTKILKRFMDDGSALPLVAETKRPDYPDVPTFEQALGDKKPSGVDWQVFRSWAGPSSVDKFFVTPPGTPADPLKILRTSFKALENDPAFNAQAGEILGDGFNILTGEETQSVIRDVLSESREVVERTNALRKKYGLPLAKGRK
jgi:tripartite-type tricarboxylate transporter receptor subunit TctC